MPMDFDKCPESEQACKDKLKAGPQPALSRLHRMRDNGIPFAGYLYLSKFDPAKDADTGFDCKIAKNHVALLVRYKSPRSSRMRVRLDVVSANGTSWGIVNPKKGQPPESSHQFSDLLPPTCSAEFRHGVITSMSAAATKARTLFQGLFITSNSHDQDAQWYPRARKLDTIPVAAAVVDQVDVSFFGLLEPLPEIHEKAADSPQPLKKTADAAAKVSTRLTSP